MNYYYCLIPTCLNCGSVVGTITQLDYFSRLINQHKYSDPDNLVKVICHGCNHEKMVTDKNHLSLLPPSYELLLDTTF